MLGSAVEPVTMATRPENRLAVPAAGSFAPMDDAGSAGPMPGILSQDGTRCHAVRAGEWPQSG